MITDMLSAIEARQRKVVFTGERWVRNRRQTHKRAHFLNDRRGRYTLTRAISLLAFVVVLVTVSVATWAYALTTWNASGAIAIFFHVTALWGVLAFKPYRLRMQPANQ